MQYEMALIGLIAFGGLLLVTYTYLNSMKIKKIQARITSIEKELAEWGKEIEKE